MLNIIIKILCRIPFLPLIITFFILTVVYKLILFILVIIHIPLTYLFPVTRRTVEHGLRKIVRNNNED